MLAFGLGTLPATLLAGAASNGLKKWLNLPLFRLTTASLFIMFGLYTLYSLIQTGQMAHHHH
jgi:sulfite exporter TauE/SafE